MGSYILQIPEDGGVVLSGTALRKLLAAGNGDAALLYLAVLRDRGGVDEKAVCGELGWPVERLRQALDCLSAQGLVRLPEQVPPEPPRRPEERRPDYTRADMARALEGQEFAGLTGAVEDKLGKKLTTPDLAILLGLYDQLGLPSDVIYLLVSFCAERVSQRYGKGRQPTLRQIEKEGYIWARQGLLDQESAAAYIRDSQRRQEDIPRMMRLLGLGERKPGVSEERYLTAWSGMGFDDEALELAYDKTILKCKELRWAYMNKILSSWHQKGLHTMAQIREGDRRTSGQAARIPGQPQAAAGQAAAGQAAAGQAAREDMARMEKYLQKLRREKEES